MSRSRGARRSCAVAGAWVEFGQRDGSDCVRQSSPTFPRGRPSNAGRLRRPRGIEPVLPWMDRIASGSRMAANEGLWFGQGNGLIRYGNTCSSKGSERSRSERARCVRGCKLAVQGSALAVRGKEMSVRDTDLHLALRVYETTGPGPRLQRVSHLDRWRGSLFERDIESEPEGAWLRT